MIGKFFTPDANWSWLVFEGEEQLDPDTQEVDVVFFGMVHGFEKAMGYFTLNELLKVRGRLGLPIEHDQTVFKVPYGEGVK